MRQLIRLLHRTYMDTQLSKFSVNTPSMLTCKLSRSAPVVYVHSGFERPDRTTASCLTAPHGSRRMVRDWQDGGRPSPRPELACSRLGEDAITGNLLQK